MSKSLIITEKPSVAGDIAKALGKVPKREATTYENEQYVISWAVGSCRGAPDAGGHRQEEIRLLAARDAADHPEEFELKPIEEDSRIATMHLRSSSLKKLIARKDIKAVINACDAGREGELIFNHLCRAREKQAPGQSACGCSR